MSNKLRVCADCARLLPKDLQRPSKPRSGYCGRHQRMYSLYRYHVITKGRDRMEVCVDVLGLDSEGAKAYINLRQRGRVTPDPKRQLCVGCGHNPTDAGEDYCPICLEEFTETPEDIDLEALSRLQNSTNIDHL